MRPIFRRYLVNLCSIFLLFIVVILLSFLFVGDRQPTTKLEIDSVRFQSEVAKTPAEQAKGLSGRNSLAPHNGMLFVFSQAGRPCFWMKDMHFNLDIAWFNAQKQLIFAKNNLSPGSYPQSFCPTVLAKYVVELPAGTLTKFNIKTGSHLSF